MHERVKVAKCSIKCCNFADVIKMSWMDTSAKSFRVAYQTLISKLVICAHHKGMSGLVYSMKYRIQ
jgi:hypothetical protein